MAVIPLTQGYYALIDDDDFDWLSKLNWHAKVRHTKVSTTVYAGTNIIRDPCNWRNGYRWVSMHRLILNEPDGEVDHINGDGLDNRRSNLRVCTHSENLRNRRPYGRSKFLGVVFDDSGGSWRQPWRANIGQRRLGRFTTEEAAARAYDAAAH